ncbi:hypothetical protein EDB80DRAFT_810840 [Ilyonectria destructans]|nr:hypothetical protein EDB80DRAFT_810840 [Ilyonectria destructans]
MSASFRVAPPVAPPTIVNRQIRPPKHQRQDRARIARHRHLSHGFQFLVAPVAYACPPSAMEPPAKRRRQGASTFRADAEPSNEADIDELASSPPPQDQGYQLAIKRAQADQKLHATMAHIIEKYSQNFDGIGDEIDMETGEIVVNNGHLRSMRHEGDLGGGDDGDDDDEGILLEDLTDECSEGDQEDISEVQDSEEADNEDPEEEVSNEAEGDEEDLVVEGRQMASESNSLMPLGGPGGFNMPGGVTGAQLGAIASLFPNAYGGGLVIGFLPAFGAPPQSFGPPQLSNGAPPFNYGTPPIGQSPQPVLMGPWAMPGVLPPQAWGQPDEPVQQPPQPKQHTPKRHTPKSKGERYKFPTQKGDTSIWAPHSRQQDDDKPLVKRKPGRPAKPQEPKPPANDPSSQNSNWEDKDGPESGGDDHGARRKSGRIRKQVEYTGKVSWLEANRQLELDANTSSQPSESGATSQGNSQRSEEKASQESRRTPKSAQAAKKTTKPKGTAKTDLGRIIPDSQDSATPPASSAPQPSQPSQPFQTAQPKGDQSHTNIFDNSGVNPALDLSDDEAPLALSGHRVGGATHISTEPDPETQPPDIDLDGDQQELITTPSIPKKRSPSGSNKMPSSKPNSEAKRKAGRPRKVPGSPTISLSRDIKWLQKVSQNSPQAMLAPDIPGTAEVTTQEKGAGSGKMLRSAKARTSPKSRKAAVEKPKEAPDANLASPAPKSTLVIPTAKDEASLDKGDDPQPLVAEKIPPPQTSTPKRKKVPFHDISHNTPQRPSPTPSQSSKPHTPRLTAIRTTRAPSSRRSILSLVSADSDSENENDELGRGYSARPSISLPRSSGASTIKAWRSSTLTTETFRTPVKKRHGEPISPGSVVKTPGGTVRACGVGGYQCRRDFCFSCL